MDAGNAFVISSRAQVSSLAQRLGPFGLARAGTIRVSLPGNSAAENERLETRLNRLRNACGCDWAAALAVAAPLAYLVVRLLGPGELGFWAALMAVALFAAGGALGKAVGLFLAGRRLRRELGSLLAVLPPDRAVERNS